MKRSGPLKRRTPLRARKATKPPADDPEAVSEHRGLDPAIYAAVVRRDQDCRAKGVIPGVCQGRHDPHHVWRKGQGGPDHKDNLVLLCRFHHNWVHNHVAMSVDFGFLSKAAHGMEGARAAAALRRAIWP